MSVIVLMFEESEQVLINSLWIGPFCPACAALNDLVLIGCLNGGRADKAPGFPAVLHHSALLSLRVCVFITNIKRVRTDERDISSFCLTL